MVARRAPARDPDPLEQRAAGLYVWDAAGRKLAEVPHASPVADGSGVEWTADDTRLIVALRKREEDNAAAARFKALTEGPIIVQSSKDPFLDWDDLQRATLFVLPIALVVSAIIWIWLLIVRLRTRANPGVPGAAAI